jgi:uncharacterized protein
MSRPVSESERIESMDVLRGFALAGILQMNIQAFSMVSAAYLNPTAYGDLGGANLWVWIICHIFVDQKFISIFSMLFGAGIVLMWQRAESRGGNARRLHYRRVGWMILFGLLHAHLFWFGDILYSYGMCGLAVYFFRDRSPRALVAAALAFAAIGSAISVGIGLSIPFWPPEAVDLMNREDWQPSPEVVEREVAIYRGSWLDQMQLRPADAALFQLMIFPVLLSWRLASLMLLGMALYKLGALSARWSRREYLQLIGAGALVGVPVVVFGIVENFERNWDVRYSFFQGMAYNYWGSYLVALGWIGFIMLWCRSSLLPRLKSRVAAVGRTAFSNYILQTLICTTIFYGHGFGLFGSVERTGQALIALAIYGAQLLIAPLWLKYFSLGPLEWIWRRLTYGKPQPLWR